LDPTDHRARTRNDGQAGPEESCWLPQRYDDTAGRPKRVHSRKEEHNWGCGRHTQYKKRDGDGGLWIAVDH
jgi:hypothetical protein